MKDLFAGSFGARNNPDDEYLEPITIYKDSPRIGIIGATSPSRPYKTRHGFEAGYGIRKYLENHPGTVFTGGVEGIGSDAYAGVVKFCMDVGIQTGNVPDDKFFVVIPNNLEYPDRLNKEKIVRIPYSPPHMYSLLARFLPKGKVEEVRAGKNMYERRLYLAAISDILVVVNGGPGTDHEAYTGLEAGKRVITLPYTGGTASILESVKKGEYDPTPKFPKSGLFSKFSTLDTGDFIKSLDPDPLNFKLVNPDLITVANSKEELVGELERLLAQ
ncbi:Uncharacterised protein [uncultured archaeon]|nr:Uncharacterised protein [uncultured archaeon]